MGACAPCGCWPGKAGQKDERKTQKDYWNWFSKHATIEGVMLGTHELDAEDRAEIFGQLPSFKGKHVLELAAGIGRFTGTIADQAQHVTAIDFVQEYTDKNAETNKHRKNCTCLCADVVKYEHPDEQLDLSSAAGFSCT